MTQTLLASTWVDAPAVPERRIGLLSVATVIDNVDGHALFDGVTWDSEVCGRVGFFDNDTVCMTDGQNKDIAGINPESTEGVGTSSTPFVVYAGVECSLLTSGDDRYERAARERLNRLGTLAVERAISDRWSAALAGEVWPETAMSLVNAISTIELALADAGGLGMIHMTPGMATRAAAANLLVRDGNTLTTFLGTPVVVGAGYRRAATWGIGTVVPADGEQFIFGTGWITLLRGPVVENTGLDVENNIRTALAEQIYVPMVECPGPYAILVEAPA